MLCISLALHSAKNIACAWWLIPWEVIEPDAYKCDFGASCLGAYCTVLNWKQCSNSPEVYFIFAAFTLLKGTYLQGSSPFKIHPWRKRKIPSYMVMSEGPTHILQVRVYPWAEPFKKLLIQWNKAIDFIKQIFSPSPSLHLSLPGVGRCFQVGTDVKWGGKRLFSSFPVLELGSLRSSDSHHIPLSHETCEHELPHASSFTAHVDI